MNVQGKPIRFLHSLLYNLQNQNVKGFIHHNIVIFIWWE